METTYLLPAQAYFSDEWFEREQRLLFGHTWHLVASAEELREPGDYATVAAGHDLGGIGVVDQHAGQGVGVQLHHPGARGGAADQQVGRRGEDGIRAQPAARAGVQFADLGRHFPRVGFGDVARLGQRPEIGPRQDVEMGQTAAHRGVEPVALRQLQPEAFGQVARAELRRYTNEGA